TRAVRELAADHDLVLIEGAGGLLVPMGVHPASGHPWTAAELAVAVSAPAVVVVRAGLGTLNHTALTIEALQRRGVPASLVIGAWPRQPQLVHETNLTDLATLAGLIGAVPEAASALAPEEFRADAPCWFTAPLT
ncbi:MAG: ATP-dependent dethiobiotin synthetase BioD, partial [Micromonosporaceae bacterium]